MTRTSLLFVLCLLFTGLVAVADAPSSDVVEAPVVATQSIPADAVQGDTTATPTDNLPDLEDLRSEIFSGAQDQAGTFCGGNICNPKTQFCCNASCGICAPIGGGCTQQSC